MDAYVLNQIKNWTIGIFFGVISVLTVVLPSQLFLISRGRITDELPKTPDSFIPQVRLVAFTDSHNNNEHVAKAIDTAYALFDNDEKYAGVDAFFGLGDFSSVGAEGDYERYAETISEHIRQGTPFINIHGNHEFKDDNYREYFIRHFGYEPDTVTEINGFQCIAFSGERGLTEWTFSPKSLAWLDKAITGAEKNSQGKPVFVFQHPHAWGTVYGSTCWSCPQLNVIFNKHPGIVDFSGHSHFPMNDPRSILQTTYTTVGCGAMASFELDKNGIPGQHPQGYDPAAQMCVIEADGDGSVRILGYDLISDTYFCDYYVDDVNNRDTYAYTYKNLKAHDSSPVFGENTAVSAVRTDSGEWGVTFDAPSVPDGYIVHDYKIVLRDSNGKTVFKDTVINDYYIVDGDETFSFKIDGDILSEGSEYSLSITAKSAYHHKSTVKLNFTAG
ncbi:MAG: metallophosphoesterase [Clostridiales bacterium]|nr:metallophosphoesterase [Clostridiales bacterium]